MDICTNYDSNATIDGINNSNKNANFILNIIDFESHRPRRYTVPSNK